jgi:hypothetical protein
MKGKGEVLLICDGTGFGYGSHCLIGWYRGKVMKKVKAHCKVVIVLGEMRDERMILSIKVGSSYGDERKMFLRWLKEVKGKIGEKVKFVADGLYGKSIEILRQVKRIGWKAYVKVRKGIWQGVRAKERKEAMREWEEGKEIYRKRYKIEQVIGSLKRAYGDVCSEREKAMAKKAIIMMGILWNMAVLLATGFVGFIFLFFKFAFEMVWLANPFYSDRRFFEHTHPCHSFLSLPFKLNDLEAPLSGIFVIVHRCDSHNFPKIKFDVIAFHDMHAKIQIPSLIDPPEPS